MSPHCSQGCLRGGSLEDCDYDHHAIAAAADDDHHHYHDDDDDDDDHDL